MTPEPPPSSSRRARPGADARRRALGLDEGTDQPTPTPDPASESKGPSEPTERRESLRDSLARIPDLEAEEAIPAVPVGVAASEAGVGAGATPTKAATKAATPTNSATKAAPPAAAIASVPPADPPVEVEPASEALEDQLRVAFSSPPPPPGGSGPKSASPVGKAEPVPALRRSKPPMWRRVTFAVVLVGLIAAIPVLGYAGYELISESTSGNFSGTSFSPTDPGYEAPVDPTPTAVAIQFDDEQVPTGVTFMSLAGGEGGGSVIFVPLDTEVSEPSYGVDRLRTAYSLVADRPTVARERLASQVGRLLNAGVDEVIDIDNAGWEQLVAPVGPLTIDNPDEVDLGFGQIIPAGQTTLTAAQTGAYLAAKIEGESDLNRMTRHEAVWSAWLEQLAASGEAEAVPGESSAGISKFVQALASGPVTYETLPVTAIPGLIPLFRIDKPAVDELITDTIAAPTAAVPGSRFTVRLLNGVAPDAIPSDLVRQIVSSGGAVTILGNGPSFDTEETTVVYANPNKKDLATLVASSLGATGKVRLDREAPDTVDLTIVLGKDVLGDGTGEGAPGATTPETTAPGGD